MREMHLKHIRGTLLYLETVEHDDAIQKLAAICGEYLRTGSFQIPTEPTTACRHEPDERFGVQETYVNTVPGLDAWRYNKEFVGRFICKQCSVLYVAAYNLKEGASDPGTLAECTEIEPVATWEAPVPAACPDCDGTGKVPAREEIWTHGEEPEAHTSTRCDTCYGSGKVDPKALEELEAERAKAEAAILKLRR